MLTRYAEAFITGLASRKKRLETPDSMPGDFKNFVEPNASHDNIIVLPPIRFGTFVRHEKPDDLRTIITDEFQ